MSKRDLSPIPESPEAQSASTSVSEDDIEIVPASVSAGGDATKLWPDPLPEQRPTNATGNLLTAFALAAALVLGYWSWSHGESEHDHPNWRHIEAAAAASTDGSSRVVAVGADGAQQLVGQLSLGGADLAAEATQEVRVALKNDDLPQANRLLQARQKIPTTRQGDAVLPTIDNAPDLAAELEEGSKQLFQVELFDCCDEDGDVVDVLVNGQSFATVPIMHEGTLLTVPLSRGPNSISVQGVRDGGGGVTLALTTSEGHFFMRYLAVGEVCEIGVQVQ